MLGLAYQRVGDLLNVACSAGDSPHDNFSRVGIRMLDRDEEQTGVFDPTPVVPTEFYAAHQDRTW